MDAAILPQALRKEEDAHLESLSVATYVVEDTLQAAMDEGEDAEEANAAEDNEDNHPERQPEPLNVRAAASDDDEETEDHDSSLFNVADGVADLGFFSLAPARQRSPSSQGNNNNGGNGGGVAHIRLDGTFLGPYELQIDSNSLLGNLLAMGGVTVADGALVAGGGMSEEAFAFAVPLYAAMGIAVLLLSVVASVMGLHEWILQNLLLPTSLAPSSTSSKLVSVPKNGGGGAENGCPVHQEGDMEVSRFGVSILGFPNSLEGYGLMWLFGHGFLLGCNWLNGVWTRYGNLGRAERVALASSASSMST